MFLRDDFFILRFKFSYSVENTHNSFFTSEQDTLCHNWIKKNDFKPWVKYRTHKIPLQVITSISYSFAVLTREISRWLREE